MVRINDLTRSTILSTGVIITALAGTDLPLESAKIAKKNLEEARKAAQMIERLMKTFAAVRETKEKKDILEEMIGIKLTIVNDLHEAKNILEKIKSKESGTPMLQEYAEDLDSLGNLWKQNQTKTISQFE